MQVCEIVDVRKRRGTKENDAKNKFKVVFFDSLSDVICILCLKGVLCSICT